MGVGDGNPMLETQCVRDKFEIQIWPIMMLATDLIATNIYISISNILVLSSTSKKGHHRIPTVKLKKSLKKLKKFQEKAFLKSETRTSVTLKL